MSLKHGLLGLLDEKSMTGYELKKLFNESLNFFWFAQTSQIYRDLGELEKKGFLESRIEEQSGKPDKRLYTITGKGREEFLSWLNDCDFSPSLKFRDSVLIKIFFGSKGDPLKIIEGLEEYILLNEEHLISYKRARQIMDKYGAMSEELNKSRTFWKMTVSRGAIVSRGNIEWARECIDILNDISSDSSL